MEAPQLFVAIEGARPAVGASRHSLAGVDEVIIGRADGRSVHRAERRLILGVPDARMSSTHGKLVRAGGGWTYHDAGSRNGSRVNGEAVTTMALDDGALIELGRTLFQLRARFAVTPATEADRSTSDLSGLLPGLATLIPTHEAQLAALARVAETSDVPILLVGEIGTGKETLARTIHARSRRPGDFVLAGCAALPDAQVEAMLAGPKGLVRAAHQGTIFLDDIAALSRSAQAALLRALQERGVDARVVASAHAPLEPAAERGDFRSDLYGRVAGYVHALPPLRARKEDIGLLVAQLLPRLVKGGEPPGFAPDVARTLYEHDWPRNIRELAQTLSVALVLSRDGRIERQHLGESILREKAAAPRAPSTEDDAALRATLHQRLLEHQGNVTQVAKSMGKARMQIQRWMKRFGIDPDTYRR